MLKVLEENKLMEEKNLNQENLLLAYGQESQENGANIGANSLI